MFQDKYMQKVHFSQHGIPLPEFMEVRPLFNAVLKVSLTKFSRNHEFVKHFNP